MGLRGLDVCTGCGPGAMKGPMKGATIGHAKQRIEGGRYIGVTEPGIIAAEPPNPIVNQLVILPDIEKRLEAFVRLAHGIVVFPGGAGTAEEILYLIGMLLDPANKDQPFPIVFTGPKESAAYFDHIKMFIQATLGHEATKRFTVIIDDPAEVARYMVRHMAVVREFRRHHNDSYNFNWLLSVKPDFQHPFEVTHESMRAHRAGSQATNTRAGSQFTPAFLRHRHRQREGIRHQGHRKIRPLRDRRRPRDHEAAGRSACGFRRAAAHEIAGNNVSTCI